MRRVGAVLAAVAVALCVFGAGVDAAFVTVPLTGGVLWPTHPRDWRGLQATNLTTVTGSVTYDDAAVTSKGLLAIPARTLDDPSVPKPGYAITLQVGAQDLASLSLAQDASDSMGFPMLQFYKSKFIGMAYRYAFTIASGADAGSYLFQVEGLTWSIVQTNAALTPLKASGYFSPPYRIPRRS